MSVAPETPPRGVDPRWWDGFRRRVERLAARADRGSAKEKAKLERAAIRAQRIVEHGTLITDLIEMAEAPFDLSAVKAPRSVREFRRKPTPALYEPRGFVATVRRDGRFAVTDPKGLPVRGITLTASGDLIEAPDLCDCGCGAVVELVQRKPS